jgi:hypothetical protein
MSIEARRQRFLPGGKPRYVHVYDNGGETFDRYTVVFTGRYTHKTGGEHMYIGASAHPFHPQGFGQHGYSEPHKQIDYPSYGHLGKKISFDALPPDVQKMTLNTYEDLWDLRGKATKHRSTR